MLGDGIVDSDESSDDDELLNCRIKSWFISCSSRSVRERRKRCWMYLFLSFAARCSKEILFRARFPSALRARWRNLSDVWFIWWRCATIDSSIRRMTASSHEEVLKLESSLWFDIVVKWRSTKNYWIKYNKKNTASLVSYVMNLWRVVWTLSFLLLSSNCIMNYNDSMHRC